MQKMKTHPNRKRVLRKLCGAMEMRQFGFDYRIYHAPPFALKWQMQNIAIARLWTIKH
jgi:hypothetical protein